MRLLDVHTVSENRLPVFHDILENGSESLLQYAILSHTWGKGQDNQEIVFDDIPSSETFARFMDEAAQLKQWQAAIGKKKKGFSKMINACKTAGDLRMHYIWIDSCCIDKSKSAELNESINSMYRWYQDSQVCIVYLEDLEPDGDLGQCRWFKRGWTLQELVAPHMVLFFRKDWTTLGERSDADMCSDLSSITGIDMDCLKGHMKLDALSIAHRMSWANGRETTVPEDRAYSLMGIFNVNMPLIYGEGGTKAFQRLQEEIVRLSSDLSILAWDPDRPDNTALDIFALSPDHFTDYKDIVPSYQSHHFTRTNKGIEMKTILWRILCEDGKERLMLAIGKQRHGKQDMGIILRKVGHNIYIRRGKMRPFSEEATTTSTSTAAFYLASPHSSIGYAHVLDSSRSQAIVIPPEVLENFRVRNSAPEYAWDCEDGLFFNNRHWGGSDWRAAELVRTDSAPQGYLESDWPERGWRCIALFIINAGTPQCYLLPWEEDLAFLFDRRHRTKTTSSKEFRDIIDEATDEVKVQGRRTMFLSLIPEGSVHGKHFRMNIRPTIRHSIPVEPTAATNSRLKAFERPWARILGRNDQTEKRLFSQVQLMPESFSGSSRTYDQTEKRVFSQSQLMPESFSGSDFPISFAALSKLSCESPTHLHPVGGPVSTFLGEGGRRNEGQR